MQISEDKSGDVTVVSVRGSVDATTADEMTSYLEGRVREGAARMVVDLGGVDYISSAGLRSFLSTLKLARQAGGDLRLAAARDGVAKVLSMAGFTSIMKVYPDVATAVSSFA